MIKSLYKMIRNEEKSDTQLFSACVPQFPSVYNRLQMIPVVGKSLIQLGLVEGLDLWLHHCFCARLRDLPCCSVCLGATLPLE